MSHTLSLHTAPDVPVEAEVIGPDRLAGLSASKVAAFPVQSGNRQARAGELFRVSGKGDGEVRVARDVADHAVACLLSPAGGAPRRPPAGKYGLIPLAGLWILEKGHIFG